MKKRKDIQIYEHVFWHLDYGQDDNALFTPVNVGSLVFNNKEIEIKDSDGDNIAEYNYFFAEESGTYWMWKNAPKTKYIGQCQYRRRFDFAEDFDFDEIFKNHDIILPIPYKLPMTLKEHYEIYHIENDIEIIENIIKTKFEKYTYSFNRVINGGNILFYSAGYIMKREDFVKWCEFYFSVMEEYSKHIDFRNKKKFEIYIKNHMPQESSYKYQMLSGGFLAERLFTMWVMSHYDAERIKFVNYKFMESTADMSRHYGMKNK